MAGTDAPAQGRDGPLKRAMNTTEPKEIHLYDPVRGITADEIRQRFLGHIKYTCYKDWRTATDYNKYIALACVARDYMAARLIATQRTYLERDVKRTYYLSMEYLLGTLLHQHLLALGILEPTHEALASLDLKLEDVLRIEADAGLGNGGLGRLAACFMESLASLEYPAYGYGLLYEHGMFIQEFENGWQVEKPDDWLKYGVPWELVRPEHTVPVYLYGRVIEENRPGGERRSRWVDWQMIEGVPHDIGIPGHHGNTVNLLRLWSSRASEGFRLDVFHRGEYVKAVESENWAETITKVLYPSDSVYAGKELRLIQEYFLVTCAIRDLIRRYRKNHSEWSAFAKKNAVHLNDTHPTLAVAELMRFFLDDADLPWDVAWDLTTRTCAYTNHTLLPEALERWPVDLMQRVLPRHMQIIFDINARVLQQVEVRFPGDVNKLRAISMIEETFPRQVRMTHLAVAGSHSVNGVSALHSDLLRRRLLPDFFELWPERFNNKTNGISHRRWLLQCNEKLAALVERRIGPGFRGDLNRIAELAPFAEDPEFRAEFRAVKRENKLRLLRVIRELTGESVSPDTIFDVQTKRIHEYKRQLLNAMHIIALYRRLKADPDREIVPRTFIFGGKAAPNYHLAKRIVKLINSIARVVNVDPDVDGRLKVVFVPDYRVSLAEIIIPAADLSEQISTAGTEASGTGNMKLALNGALTIGTWDGANIEIAEAVGLENIFIFGHRTEELVEMRRQGYCPRDLYEKDVELREVVDAIRRNDFNPSEPDLFAEIAHALLDGGDYYFHLADFRAYLAKQEEVSARYRDPEDWSRRAILNVSRMGYFSSDRAIREYAEQIWGIQPCPIWLLAGNGRKRPE